MRITRDIQLMIEGTQTFCESFLIGVSLVSILAMLGLIAYVIYYVITTLITG